LAALIATFQRILGKLLIPAAEDQPYRPPMVARHAQIFDEHKFADAARLSFVHSLLPTKTDSFRPILNAQAAKEPTKNSCKEALRAAAIRLYEEDNTILTLASSNGCRRDFAISSRLLQPPGLEDSQWRRIEG